MFNGKSKEEKEQDKIQAFMQKYNLHNLDAEDLEIVKKITADLAGNGFFKMGMALSFSSAPDQAKTTYLSALAEQNWLIINQLSRLNKNVEKLLDK